MSAISFSLPSHSICETGQALVQTQPHVFQLVNLPDLNLDFCPDVLILDNKHYTYQGVEHGRAIYALDPLDIETLATEFYECAICQYRTVTFHADIKTEDCTVAESQGSNPPCSICNGPTVRLLCPLERNIEKGSRVEVELKDLSLHVDAHNSAYQTCPRCENLAKVLSDLLENPPGFDGIKVGSDHFGNKYIDYGWLEAIRRVQAAMVLSSCGTTTEKDQK